MALLLTLLALPTLLPDARAEVFRESRLAMGTVVGVTADAPDADTAHRAADAAFVAIERWEAELSEWRPDSATSRMNAGETVTFSPEGTRMLELAEQIHVASGGAFSLLWQGGTLEHAADGWRVAGGRAGLGAILKGFLADRAADALVASGLDDFVVDAAGDVVAHGPGDTGRGWRVTVVSEDEPIAKVILRDAALSTSGGDQQPGHIKDPRTGEPVTCSRVATVVAPRGEIADALATATYASCGQRGLAERFGAKSLWIGADGSRRWSRGARRVFRR